MFCDEHGTIDYCPECLNESNVFDIGDVVEVDLKLAVVVGVIHDSEQLFVDFGNGEVEFHFNEVSGHWTKK